VKKILFTRSGGGLAGLDVHAGIWLALEEAGIVSTANAGTSAGAIASAFDSAGFSAAEAGMIIRGLGDRDIRDEVFAWKLRIFWLDYFLKREPVAAVLEKYLPRSFFQLEKPLQVFSVRTLDGACLSMGDVTRELRTAVMASMSICGVFPKVRIPDDDFSAREYVDGSPKNNLGVPDNWKEFDEIYVLIAGGAPQSYRKRTGILTNLIQNAAWMGDDQIDDDVLDLMDAAPEKVHVIWPRLPHPKGALHFDHDLIRAAHDFTAAWLAGEGKK
jgi:predicted acylesterase/phospholipase RssA